MPMPRLHVMPAKCVSCIFGPDSPIEPDRFRELMASWIERVSERFQVCHLTGVDGDDLSIERIAVCRGWYDEMYVKRGIPWRLCR